MRWLLVAFLLAGCSSAPAATPDAGIDPVLPTVPAVDVEWLLSDLEAFATSFGERAGNSAAHLGAREFLTRQYESIGLEVWRQGFVNGIPQENIVGIKWGEDRNTWVVVGSHYDIASKECSLLQGNCVLRPYSQGAYDDASGTLLTVHLARAFANVTTPYTIAFANFDGEERGLQGSRAFAETVMFGDSPYGNVTVRGMLNLDMFGINWPGTIAPIYLDENSAELASAAGEAAAALGMPEEMLEYTGIRLGRSDYHWFMEAGVPTAFFISSFEKWELPNDAGVLFESTTTGTPADSSSAYPFWHLEDTWDTMVAMAGSEEDLEAGFEAAAHMSAALLHRMAADTAPLSVELEE